MESISVIVLAGGASQRMGANKALLPLGDNETLIGRVVANLRVLSDDIVLVSNTPELYADLPVRHCIDRFKGAGPLAGLHAGLLTRLAEAEPKTPQAARALLDEYDAMESAPQLDVDAMREILDRAERGE